MKAYLDLNTGKVYKPPYRRFLQAETNFEGLSINDQLYFLEDDKDILVYAPYDRFAALIDRQEYEYLLAHPVSDDKIPKDLVDKKFYGVKRPEVGESKDIIFNPTDLTVFLGDACNLRCVYCNATRARDAKNLM